MNQTKKLTFDNFSKIYVSDIYLNAYLKNIDFLLFVILQILITFVFSLLNQYHHI